MGFSSKSTQLDNGIQESTAQHKTVAEFTGVDDGGRLHQVASLLTAPLGSQAPNLY